VYLFLPSIYGDINLQQIHKIIMFSGILIAAKGLCNQQLFALPEGT
jgi:hypothetical protein